jgi:predicted RNA-binding Zn ribbon-like protein
VLGEPALELLQSRRADGVDLVDDVDWLRSATRRWAVEPGRMPTADETASLKRLRQAMRGIVAILDDGRLPNDAELAELNTFVTAVPVLARLERYGDGFVIDMTPVAEGWTLVARELAGWFGSLLRADPWRLKLCANPECRLPFYDGSKSRTRRWHDNATCGNRDRVRRFRERHGARP